MGLKAQPAKGKFFRGPKPRVPPAFEANLARWHATRHLQRKAFTLIELPVVAAILAAVLPGALAVGTNWTPKTPSAKVTITDKDRFVWDSE